MDIKDLGVDKTWTLFLDRDGVINEKLENDYVKNLAEFKFIKGAKEAIVAFSKIFGRIVVVTNQQGIGKGIMSHEELKIVHDYMQEEIEKAGGKLDQIYYCPELAAANAPCRKPNIGMAEQAQKDFPEIDFEKSIMIGDSVSDIEMGVKTGMFTVFISSGKKSELADWKVGSLSDLKF
ncbi:MAG: HAD family hydrolase [Bacteroidetes bacterium]|nr:MAG: HAD family hydrolase [Bacteroidota bacterium]MBL1144727.1 HAD family hydrolase [Bacteroidota bacterium]MCB0802796.1 HAD family hydrolase [Flavobacteriales bacterium]NOG57521.1 HAD family hydrolase [Bacteroidota bacterium]